VISSDFTFFESRSYFEKESSLVEFDDDDPMYFLLNLSLSPAESFLGHRLESMQPK